MYTDLKVKTPLPQLIYPTLFKLTVLHKDVAAPSRHGCEDSGREISSRVDSVATIVAKGGTNDQQHQTDGYGLDTGLLWFHIVGVTDREDTNK